MRVWIVENTPDYEQATRVGVYASPMISWNDFFTQVDEHVFRKDEFHVRITTGPEPLAHPERADVVIHLAYNSGDSVTLTGVYVEGTGDAEPTEAEWRDVQQVSALLMQHAVQEAGFTRVSEYQEENGKPSGAWRFRRGDDYVW